MIALRAVIWTAALALAAVALFGCEARIEVGVAQQEGVWKQQAMVNGPSIYWTCLHGNRIYALQPLASRATSGLWPGASIAVAAGGCK